MKRLGLILAGLGFFAMLAMPAMAQVRAYGGRQPLRPLRNLAERADERRDDVRSGVYNSNRTAVGVYDREVMPAAPAAGPTVASHGSLGVTLSDQNSTHIASIAPGSPAARGGLRVGDEIINVNDREVASRDELVQEVQSAGSGDVSMMIVRNGREREIVVPLGQPMATRAQGDTYFRGPAASRVVDGQSYDDSQNTVRTRRPARQVDADAYDRTRRTDRVRVDARVNDYNDDASFRADVDNRVDRTSDAARRTTERATDRARRRTERAVDRFDNANDRANDRYDADDRYDDTRNRVDNRADRAVDRAGNTAGRSLDRARNATNRALNRASDAVDRNTDSYDADRGLDRARNATNRALNRASDEVDRNVGGDDYDRD